MIDWTKPIELVGGGRAILLRPSTVGNGSMLVDTPDHPYGTRYRNTQRVYDADGSNTSFPNNPPIRNKEMKMIDFGKPLTTAMEGKEARVVHLFENGHRALVIDGSTKVVTVDKFGYSIDGTGVSVVNPVTRTHFWYCVNTRTNSTGRYDSLANARSYSRQRPEIIIIHEKLENDVVVSREIIND